MSNENLYSMLSEARQNLFEKNCFECKMVYLGLRIQSGASTLGDKGEIINVSKQIHGTFDAFP